MALWSKTDCENLGVAVMATAQILRPRWPGTSPDTMTGEAAVKELQRSGNSTDVRVS